MSPTTRDDEPPRCRVCGLELVLVQSRWVCPENPSASSRCGTWTLNPYEPMRLRDVLFPHSAVRDADPMELRDLLCKLQQFMDAATARHLAADRRTRTVDRSDG